MYCYDDKGVVSGRFFGGESRVMIMSAMITKMRTNVKERASWVIAASLKEQHR